MAVRVSSCWLSESSTAVSAVLSLSVIRNALCSPAIFLSVISRSTLSLAESPSGRNFRKSELPTLHESPASPEPASRWFSQ